MNGSYYCIILKSKQNKRNSMSRDPKLSEELSIELGPNFGGGGE